MLQQVWQLVMTHATGCAAGSESTELRLNQHWYLTRTLLQSFFLSHDVGHCALDCNHYVHFYEYLFNKTITKCLIFPLLIKKHHDAFTTFGASLSHKGPGFEHGKEKGLVQVLLCTDSLRTF